MIRLLKFLPITALSLFLISCRGVSDKQTTEADHSSPHWRYEGQESPEHWAELSPDFKKCAEGHFQSPIDIESYAAKEQSGSVLTFNYHPSLVDEVNNGHTIQANLEEVNTFTVDEHIYSLQQFHFHEPSEHHLDGIIFPMEMHLVHTDSTGRLAVVGVFIKEGKENRYLSDLWASLPEHVEEHVHPRNRCDLLHLLPEDKPIFHYSGSLTTPPCTEGVEWYVIKEPITLSKDQISRFRELYHDNNRPIQEQEARSLEVVTVGRE